VRFVERRHTTHPGVPTVVNYKHDQKVHSFDECSHHFCTTLNFIPQN